MKKICVVGMGYIGIPTATMFASNGCSVLGVDLKEEYIKQLLSGIYDIREPYISDAFKAVIESGRLKMSTKPAKADAYIIAVPTPLVEGNKADMSCVKAACESILPYVEKGNTVILESTSPVGTVRDLICPILEKSGLKAGTDILVAYSPERVIPGNILKELVDNERLIGGINIESSNAASELYKIFVRGAIHITDAATAELCKLAENTFRDINIAYSNELLKICDSAGLDVWEVRRLCNRHPRVDILMPGPGVGGHCIAVDPWFLVEKFPECTAVVKAARETNDGMPEFVADKINDILKDINGKKKITIMGVSYKADVDDVRESPMLNMKGFLPSDYEVSIYDPIAGTGNSDWNDIESAFSDSDLIVLGVAHGIFAGLNYAEIKTKLRHCRILDTRNALRRAVLEDLGFTYHLLGGN